MPLNKTIIKELPELKISLWQHYLFASKRDTTAILLMAYTIHRRVKKYNEEESSKRDKVVDLCYKMEKKYFDKSKNLEKNLMDP